MKQYVPDMLQEMPNRRNNISWMGHNNIEHNHIMAYFVLMDIITNPLLFNQNNTQHQATSNCYLIMWTMVVKQQIIEQYTKKMQIL